MIAAELLHVGDVIKEINGNEVTTPEQLQEIMKKSSGTVTFKIIPTMQEQNVSAQVNKSTARSYHKICIYMINCENTETDRIVD
jgi:PDZ domain-containing secreted protein